VPGPRARWSFVLPLAWAGAVVLLSRSPEAVRVLPSLGAWRGPLGTVLLVLALGLALARSGRWESLASRLRGGRATRALQRPPLLFAVATALFALVGWYHAAGLPPSGDEPHYLLMVQSLLGEGDLDLRDNFERRDYEAYVPSLPAPHYGAPRKDGRPFPAHSPGLPLLLLLPFAFGGRAGCILFLALCAAAAALEARRLALRWGGPAEGLWAWATAVGPPLFFYAFHAYTEVPAALALAVSLRLLLSEPGPAGAVGAGALACALPILHLKMALAAAALGVVALVRLRGRSRVAFLATAALGAVAFGAHYASVFGRPSPLALYGGMPTDLAFAHAPRALAGLLLDRSFGLLPNAPVYLLALAGASELRRRRAADLWPLLLVASALLLPAVTWRMWWGGQCPPARFLVPLLPWIAAVAGRRAACEGAPAGIARWRVPLLALTAALALFMVARPEARLLLNRRDNPTRLWTALSPAQGPDLNRYLPSLVGGSPAELRVAAVWALALVVLLALDIAARRRRGVERLFSGLGLPLLLLIFGGLLVDSWARSGP
jgi:hypothetical protein